MWTAADPVTFISCSVDVDHLALAEMTLRPSAMQGLSACVRSTTFAVKSIILEISLERIAILLIDQLALAALDTVLPHARVDSVDGMVRDLAISVRFSVVPLTTVCELVFTFDLAEAFYQAIFELTLVDSF